MKQPDQHFGDTIETQHRIHAEAHRRAVARNAADEFTEGKMRDAEKEHAVVTHDEAQQFLGYSAEEQASALPASGTLNWDNGDIRIAPSYVPATQPPGNDTQHFGGALSGVDAICGFSAGRR